MPVVVVHVGRVLVVVLELFVPVGVRMLTVYGWHVLMVVVAIVVAMRMLVLGGGVHVAVVMPLAEVQS